uniref:Pseudouridine synthase II N-terminal domain-containing protein n=1 Tax=Ditylenchus dipsaci TaxID=166011 RepID=A0A915DWJ8_9BILA
MKWSLNAREVQSFLNGFMCIYKPKDISLSSLKRVLITAISNQANELDDSEVPVIEMPIVEPYPKSQALVVVGTRKQLDYRLHPMMAGKMFRPEEFRLEELNYLEPSSSGVCLFGINDGCDSLEEIRDRAWTNEYALHGELGRETEDHKIRGREVAKAAFDHVKRHQICKLLSRIRMQYKKISFEFANVDLQSQDAFEIARRGAPRPRVLGSPLVYNCELKSFRTPNFHLSVQITGENDYFLRSFVHELGCSLGTLACTRRLRRSKQGPFSTDHALLDKHFSLVSILKNIQMCNKLVERAMKNNPDIVVFNRSEDEECGALVETFQLRDQLEQSPETEDCLIIPWGRSYI